MVWDWEGVCGCAFRGYVCVARGGGKGKGKDCSAWGWFGGWIVGKVAS